MATVLRILFLAPSEASTRPLEEELRRGGYRLDTRWETRPTGAQQALLGERWDLIICVGADDGARALVLWLRSQARDIPLFVVAPAAEQESAYALMHAGASDYICSEQPARLNAALGRELREMAIHRERKRALLALKESGSRLRQLTENIDEAFWLADCASGHMIYVSPACERIWGRPAAALFGGTGVFLAAVHPEDVPLVEGWLAGEGWNGLNGEYRIQQPDGAVRWVRTRAFPIHDEQGRPYRSAGLTSDITEARQLEAEYKKMSRALAQTADAVMITNREGVIEYVNDAFEDVSGYGRDEVVGQTPALLRSGFQEPGFYQLLWDTLLNGLPFTDVFINRRKDGELYYEEKTITPVRDECGNITHFVSTGKDITRRLLAQQRLHRVVHYDALTGLANRILFVDRLNLALLQARRLGFAVGVVYVCVDLSGLVGDGCSRAMEEAFQAALGQRLRDVVTDGDTVARLGRDDFAVLHKHERHGQDMEQLARRIMVEFSAPLTVDGFVLFLSPCVGISRYPEDGDDTDSLLHKAVIAMRHARGHGGQFDFYRREMQADPLHLNG